MMIKLKKIMIERDELLIGNSAFSRMYYGTPVRGLEKCGETRNQLTSFYDGVHNLCVEWDKRKDE